MYISDAYKMIVGVPRHTIIYPYFRFQMTTLVNKIDFHQICYVHWFVEIMFGIANGQILSIFERFICPPDIQIFVSRQ